MSSDRDKNIADKSIAVLIGALLLLVFLFSPVKRMGDSKYCLLVSQSLIEHGTFDITDYWLTAKISNPRGFKNPISIRKGIPYQLELQQRKIYYYFPTGTSVLSTPFVAVSMFLNKAPVENGVYIAKNERELQFVIGSTIMASLGIILYFLARVWLSPSQAFLITIIGCLGTMVWSTASRGLPSHTWGIFFLISVIYIVARERVSKVHGHIQDIILATLLSWTYFIRPTFAISIVGITLFLIWERRRIPGVYLITGLMWLIAFLAYSHFLFGRWMPNYFLPGRINFGLGHSFWTALIGVTFSPSRGLFIFVPTLLVCFYLILKYRESLPDRFLIFLSLSVISAHIVLICGFRQWWGGNSYGPRLFIDILPWCFLLGILCMRARQDALRFILIKSWKERLEISLISLVLLTAITLHGIGAWSDAVWEWNEKLTDVDKAQYRLWDWRDPQFAAPFLR